MRVLSVQVGAPKTVPGGNRASGIYKEPVAEVHLGYLGVQGDSVLDGKHHGGFSKACCLYTAEHYEHWRRQYPDGDWRPGAFGENLTVAGWTEADAAIGDVLRIGEAVVQVSQPRGPCGTLAARHGIADFVKVCRAAGLTGWYVRVLRPGVVRPGDEVVLLQPHPMAVSIDRVNRLYYTDPVEPVDLREALAVDAMSNEAREILLRRLDSLAPSSPGSGTA